MLKIKCDHCGQTLMGKDIKVVPFHEYLDGAKYQDYAVNCTKCGGSIVWDRYVQKAKENKAKALVKLARKKKKTVKQISEEEQYNIIMRKAGERAKEIAKAHSKPVKLKHLCKAIDELPQDEKSIVLAHEDKLDLELLHQGTNKPTKHIKPNSILLMTQAIIECAIADKDEDFFKSQYGAQIVDTYNNALTIHTSHDYGITADLLLEKMRKGELVKGENNDE
jgi:hypothetical protein